MARPLTVAALLAASALAAATSAFPQADDTHACQLISTGQVAAVLGYQHVHVMKDIPGRSSKDNTSGVVHSVCHVVASDGSAPATPAAVRLDVIAGHAAGFGIATWAPDGGSNYESKWTDNGFSKLVVPVLLAAYYTKTLGFAPYHAHRLKPTGGKETDHATGLSATAKGLPAVGAAVGTWWNDSSREVVSVWVEQAARRPSVAELNRFAKTVVSGFGLKPLTLH